MGERRSHRGVLWASRGYRQGAVGSSKDDGYEGQEFGCNCIGEIHELESSVIS